MALQCHNVKRVTKCVLLCLRVHLLSLTKHTYFSDQWVEGGNWQLQRWRDTKNNGGKITHINPLHVVAFPSFSFVSGLFSSSRASLSVLGDVARPASDVTSDCRRTLAAAAMPPGGPPALPGDRWHRRTGGRVSEPRRRHSRTGTWAWSRHSPCRWCALTPSPPVKDQGRLKHLNTRYTPVSKHSKSITTWKPCSLRVTLLIGFFCC